MAEHSVAGKQECSVCGGPCREPYRQPPVHDNYPFMTREQILETQRLDEEPAAEAEPEPAKGKRSRRPTEDRAHRPAENREAGA